MLKLWLVIFQLLPVKVNLRPLVIADLTCHKPEKGKDLRRRVQVVLANQKLNKHLISTVAALVGP
jgi:hypothetical protein